MATMNVKDAGDNTVAIEKPLAPGRAAAAASRPVALSTEDLAAINAITAKLISAPATEAKQDAAALLLQGIIDAIGDIPGGTGGGGDASAANQETIIAALTAIAGYVDGLEGKDYATQTTLAAVLAKLIAAPATEAKQDTLIAKDFATQTTLAAILAKIIAAPATEAKQDTIIARMVAQLGARTVAQSPAINIATDDPIAKKIGTRAYTWGSIITRTVTSTSAQTAAVGAAGEYEIATDTDCYVLVGSNPTAAATTSRFLPAGSAWTVQLGATDKVAVIRKTADGNLTVLPVA